MEVPSYLGHSGTSTKSDDTSNIQKYFVLCFTFYELFYNYLVDFTSRASLYVHMSSLGRTDFIYILLKIDVKGVVTLLCFYKNRFDFLR